MRKAIAERHARKVGGALFEQTVPVRPVDANGTAFEQQHNHEERILRRSEARSVGLRRAHGLPHQQSAEHTERCRGETIEQFPVRHDEQRGKGRHGPHGNEGAAAFFCPIHDHCGNLSGR